MKTSFAPTCLFGQHSAWPSMTLSRKCLEPFRATMDRRAEGYKVRWNCRMGRACTCEGKPRRGALRVRRVLAYGAPADLRKSIDGVVGDDPADTPPPPTKTVKAYQRRVRHEPEAETTDERGLRFDRAIPPEVIESPNSDLEGLTEADSEVEGTE